MSRSTATALAILVIGFSLAACGKKQVDCLSPESQASVSQLIKDSIEKQAITKMHDGAPQANILDSSIRASVNGLKVVLEDIRTTKVDPNSTKKFCTANARIVAPLTVINDADQARSVAGANTIAQLAQQDNVERAADSFKFPLDYDVQPTDDGKKVYSEIPGTSDRSDFFAELVDSDLLKNVVEAKKNQEAQAQAEQDREQQAALDAQRNANRAEADAEDRLAIQVINETWSQLSPAMKSGLLDLQRAWVKQKIADCNIEAASASTDPMERETARLKCDTRMNTDRAGWLRQYLGQ